MCKFKMHQNPTYSERFPLRNALKSRFFRACGALIIMFSHCIHCKYPKNFPPAAGIFFLCFSLVYRTLVGKQNTHQFWSAAGGFFFKLPPSLPGGGGAIFGSRKIKKIQAGVEILILGAYPLIWGRFLGFENF